MSQGRHQDTKSHEALIRQVTYTHMRGHVACHAVLPFQPGLGMQCSQLLQSEPIVTKPTIVQNTLVYFARLTPVAETSGFVVTHSDEALHLG